MRFHGLLLLLAISVCPLAGLCDSCQYRQIERGPPHSLLSPERKSTKRNRFLDRSFLALEERKLGRVTNVTSLSPSRLSFSLLFPLLLSYSSPSSQLAAAPRPFEEIPELLKPPLPFLSFLFCLVTLLSSVSTLYFLFPLLRNIFIVLAGQLVVSLAQDARYYF